MNKIYRSFFLFLITGVLFSSVGFASDFEEPKEVWLEFGVDKQIDDKWAVGVWANSFHHSEKGNYEWYIEPAVTYHISSQFFVEGLYRQDYFIENNTWTHENRPALRVGYKTKLKNVCFRNRHKLEMRMFELASSELRYRSDVKISPEWNLTKIKLNPYFQEEIFISQEKVSRIRSYMGIAGELGIFQPSLYLLLQSNNEINKWENNPIWGLMLGIDL